MKTILCLLLSVLTGLAAAPLPPLPPRMPPPKVNLAPSAPSRFKPTRFLSPRAEAAGLFRAEPRSTELPYLPMIASVRKVDSEFGKYEFTAGAWQPANQSLLLAKSRIVWGTSDAWEGVALFGPTPYAQHAFVSFYTFDELNFVRGTANAETPEGMEMFPTSAGVIGINPKVPGLKVWRTIAPPLPHRNAPGKSYFFGRPKPKVSASLITTESQFAAVCPYDGTKVISRSCVLSGVAATATNSVFQQTWTISFKCRICKMDFSDRRTQLMNDLQSIKLPNR